MARKVKTEETKIDVSLAERAKALDALCASLTANGSVIAGRPGVDKEVDERMTISFYPTRVPEVNDATGGGLPKGRIVLVAGDHDSGKTSFALDFIAHNQQLDPNFTSLWIESEDSLDVDKAQDLFGFDKSRFWSVFLSRKNKKEFGAEGVINAIESAIKVAAPNVVVINSLKMLVPMTEITNTAEKETISLGARLNSKMMRKFVSLLAENNTTLLLIQHYSTAIGKFSPMGTPKDITGGLAIRYANMLTLEFSNVAIQEGDPVTKENGKGIRVKVTKNHCVINRNPRVSTTYFVEYGKGIERIVSTLNRLIDAGIITKSGAWLYLLDENGEKTDMSWNGKNKFKEDMEANPDKFEQLCQMLDGNNTYDTLSEEEIEEIEEAEELEKELMDSIEE